MFVGVHACTIYVYFPYFYISNCVASQGHTYYFWSMDKSIIRHNYTEMTPKSFLANVSFVRNRIIDES